MSRATLKFCDFGAVGDGVTDNAAALQALNLEARKYDHVIIEADPLHYVYSKNNWLFRLKSFELNAYGAKLQCSNTDPFGIHFQSLHMASFWDEAGDLTSGSPVRRSGHFFANVEAGSTTITLSDPAEIAEYAIGDRVAVYGFALQDNGYPPNARYFEYQRIADIQGASLIFDVQLRFAYDERWINIEQGRNAATFGRPQVINLDRDDYVWTERAVIRGCELLINPNKTTDSWSVNARHVLIEDVTCDTMFPNSAESFEGRRCRITRQLLPDKFARQHRFYDCDIERAYGDAITAEHGILENCRIGANRQGNDSLTPSAHHWILRNNVIWSRLNDKSGIVNLQVGTRTDYVEMTGNAIINRGDQLDHVVNNAVPHTFVIEDLDGDDLLFAYTAVNFQITHRLMEHNSTIWKADGSKVGKVQNIYEHTDGRIKVEAIWSGVPEIGETWELLENDQLVTSNNQIIVGEKVPFIRYPIYADRLKTKKVTLTNHDLQFEKGFVIFQRVHGFVRSLEVDVTYSISQNPMIITIDGTELSFNIAKSGRRRIDGFLIGSLDGDVLSNDWTDTFVDIIQFKVSQAETLEEPSILTVTCEIAGFGA